MTKWKCFIIYCVITLCSSVMGFSQGINLNSGKEFADACGVNLPWSNGNVELSLAKDGAFVMDTKTDNRCAFAFPINEAEDYSIEASVKLIQCKPLKIGQLLLGIVVGFKDYNNYSVLTVLGTKGYGFYSLVNGIWVTHVSRVDPSPAVNFLSRINHIKLWKHDNKFILAINGNHVATVDAFGLMGDAYGLFVSDESKCALYDFKIVSSETPSYAESTKSSSTASSNDQMQIVGSGTGFAIDKRGYFVTNHHVIDGAGAIGICIQKDGEWVSFIGKVIKTDPTNDIAIIKIDDEDFKGFDNIPYSFSYESEDVAAEIFTLGYPRVEVMGTDVKYTTGVINSRTGIQGDPTHYQISAHIDHGNSGGPLFNAKGQIIGITDSGLDKAEFGDVNYSVKSLYIKALVESLPVKLQLPNDSRIINMSRSEQIKTISPYVALILIAQ